MKTLPKFIEELGDEAAAALFEVSVRTAASWRLRERYPRPRQAALIVQRSRQRVSYAGIYAPDTNEADVA